MTQVPNQKLIQFYLPFFTDKCATENFISKCYKKRSGRMVNHLCWLVDIADNIEKIKPGRPSLQLIFLLTCAESNSKIKENYTKEYSSRKFTYKFFDFINEGDTKLLRENFTPLVSRRTTLRGKPIILPDGEFVSFGDESQMKLKTIIDILYNIRCKTIHEGIYFDFFFKYRPVNHRELPILNKVKTGDNKVKRKRNITISNNLTYKQFRDIIVRTGINQIKSVL